MLPFTEKRASVDDNNEVVENEIDALNNITQDTLFPDWIE